MAATILEEADARSILRQVEFYFSDSNLPRDGFLRKAVEESEDGLVSLALICSFGRMRSILGLDNDTKPESVPADKVDAVSEVLKSQSTTLRISDDGKKVGRIAELLKPEELIEQLDSRTIAASPFPYDITLEDVETFFSKQAKVSSVRLPKHVSDKRYFCGTALIEFSEEEDAKKILEENLVFAGAELALKSKKEYDTEREKQIEEHKKKNADKGPSYPKGVVISFQLEKKRKSSDITDSKKIEQENEKDKALDSIEKLTGEEAPENKSEEVKGENSESAEEKPSEEGHDSKPENAESISNDIGGTQITREDLKHVFGKFGNVKYIDFSMGQESGYIRYEDSKGVETARAMAEVSEGGGLLVKDHIATVQVVAGEGCMELIWTSTSNVPTRLVPKKANPAAAKGKKGEKAGSMEPIDRKASKVKASAAPQISEAHAVFETQGTPGNPPSRKRKEAPSGSTPLQPHLDKGKRLAAEKSKKKKSRKNPEVVIVELGAIARTSDEEAIVASCPQQESTPAAIAGVSGSDTLVTTAETSKLCDLDLVDFLQAAVPDLEKDTGVIFKERLVPGFTNSLAIHLPLYASMQNSGDQKAQGHPRYAREVFRITETAYQKNIIRDRPEVALDHAISAVHDLGAILGHFKDAYDREHRNMLFVDSGGEMVKKAVLERDHYRGIAVDKARHLNVAQEKIKVQSKELLWQDKVIKNIKNEAEEGIKVRDDKIKAQEEKIKSQEERITSLTLEEAATDIRMSEKDAEISRLKGELQRAPIVTLNRFLGSNAFAQAAALALFKPMKATIYQEMQKLGHVYPFTPEHAGFAAVSPEVAKVRDLVGYRWDDAHDRLLNLDGSIFNDVLKLDDHPAEFPHPWWGTYPWPEEMPEPPEVVEEEVVDEEEEEEEDSSGGPRVDLGDQIEAGESQDAPHP